jgi:hypothetical protein
MLPAPGQIEGSGIMALSEPKRCAPGYLRIKYQTSALFLTRRPNKFDLVELGLLLSGNWLVSYTIEVSTSPVCWRQTNPAAEQATTSSNHRATFSQTYVGIAENLRLVGNPMDILRRFLTLTLRENREGLHRAERMQHQIGIVARQIGRT